MIPQFTDCLKTYLPLVLTGLLGVAVTGAVVWFLKDAQQDFERARVAMNSKAVETQIEQRFMAYERSLQAGAAFISANVQVSRPIWRQYVAQLRSNLSELAIERMGFAQLLTHEGLAEHEAHMRKQGLDDYQVAPVSEGRQPTSIVLIEPVAADSLPSLGLNMYVNGTLRAAMARARDTGRSALAAQASLTGMQVERQTGLVLFLPIYTHEAPLNTVANRRAALRGWVFSTFAMENLVDGVLGSQFTSLRIDAEGTVSKLASPFQSGPSEGAGLSAVDPVHLKLGGQAWKLSLYSPARSADAAMPAYRVIALVGGLLTLVFGFVVGSAGVAGRRARIEKEQQSSELASVTVRQQSLLEHVEEGVLAIDSQGRLRSFNTAAQAMFGYKAAEVLGQNVSQLMPERFRSNHDVFLHAVNREDVKERLQKTREVMGLRRDGTEFPVSVTIHQIDPPHGEEFLAFIADISKHKEAEQRLEMANYLRKTILQSSPFAIISTDADGTIRTLNPAGEQLLGYQAAELIGQETPCLLHDPLELRQHADELSAALGRVVPAGVESLFERAREGATECREWTFLRKSGERMPVDVTINGLLDQDGQIDGFLLMAYDITVRKRTQAYVQHVAHHDALTGLPNRVLLEDRLQQAIEQARRRNVMLGVMMVDLDHFKRINDTLGHHVGDELLLAISKRLQASLRQVDTVARLGGDEFVVIVPDMHSLEEIGKLCQHLVDELSQAIVVSGHELTVTPSIGVCNFPEDGETVQTLLKKADTAMYHAKDAGRGAYRQFEPGMLQKNQRRLETENELRRALERNELSLALQPQLNIADELLIGSEALLRWDHPTFGRVSPEIFVPLAEEMGLIESIGAWVMREACRQTVLVQKQLGNPALTVAVNVSPRQFFLQDLIGTVQSALAESGLNPNCLEVEITEGLLIQNAEQTVDMLRRLRVMGVRVAIDDFGTGYSSLSYLTRFPIDKLKIDQSFIRDISSDTDDAAVTGAIIVMAHALNLKVVAEGVETLEHVDFLRQRGCDIAQGYYYGKPLSLDDFLAWAQKRPVYGLDS